MSKQAPHIVALSSYFRKELPMLKNNYKWKIPKIKDFKKSGESSYSANVELKNFFFEKWQESNQEDRFYLAKTIVSEWGGVRNNKDSTIRRYVAQLNEDFPLTPIAGVASYSKIFSMSDLNKYAIYDARVAACLNAVQINAKVKRGVAFNYIPGRNNIVGNSLNRRGFVYTNRFKVKNLVKSGWRRIKRNETYRKYLETLYECQKNIGGYQLFDFEMVLFVNAEIECKKSVKLLNRY